MERHSWKKYLGIIMAATLFLWGCHSPSQDGETKSLPETEVSETADEEEGQEKNKQEETQQETEAKESQEETASSEVDETGEVMQDYVIPGSDARYLTDEDVKSLSKEEFRIARNEIYARHGRKFQSSDLQDYFDEKEWYEGTIEPSEFPEALLNEYEKANIQFLAEAEPAAGIAELADAPSKEIIDRYGYENGYSVLSFHIKPGTVKDHGEYYEVDAIYQQGIEAPGDLSYGQEVTLVFNELTGEKKTLVYREEGLCCEEDYSQYYYYPSEDGKEVVLYEGSDDRVDKPVYDGKLYIRKDATEEIDIVKDVRALTRESLERENWFNGVYFDQKGYVVRLVYYGD